MKKFTLFINTFLISLFALTQLTLADESFVNVYEELLASKDRCALKPSERAKGRINVVVEDKLARLYCDERALSQILDNLVTNALKYSTDKDQITLSFYVSKKGDGVITIADTGQGIPKESLEEIIQPFVQAMQANSYNAQITKKQDGIGLGLHIVSRLMALHEAHFDIESELGKGTNITLTFPLERLEKI